MEANKMIKNELYTAITRGTEKENVYTHKPLTRIREFKYVDCKKIKPKKYFNKGFVYKITNHINKEFYIGQTRRNIEQRFQEHIKGLGRTDKFHSQIEKYGKENFSIEVLEEVLFRTENELLQREKRYIINLKPDYNTLDCYRRYRKKPKIITADVQIKGIAYDKKNDRWRVRFKGIKQKSFACKKNGGKEEAFKLAFTYLTGLLPPCEF
jgi:hypothetical protein